MNERARELFDAAYEFVLRWEGGSKFHEDPGDPGGATKFGVSFRFLRDLPLRLADSDGDGLVTWRDVASLAPERAREIYRKYFWERLRLDELPAKLAFVMFDTAVNVGRSRAVRWLQEALSKYADLRIDGVLGPETTAALKEVDPNWILDRLFRRRREYYRTLASGNEWAKRYLKGWLNRTNDLEMTVLGLGRSKRASSQDKEAGGP